MKRIQWFFLLLPLIFGFSAQRVQGQTSEQPMTFSIVCQYVTNYINTTNPTTQVVTHYVQLNTVILNTANIAKAIALQLFGPTNWVRWYPANIAYEVNMVTGNTGIYLRRGALQTNISSFFGNSFSNIFSQNVNTVFSGENLATSLPLGGAINDPSATAITNFTFSDNLAYMTFAATNFSTNNNAPPFVAATNIAFDLFGYSQGRVVDGSGYLDGKLYQRYLIQAEIVGAGTFSLNVTTNVYSIMTTNGTPTNYTGVAHGTVYVGIPYFLTIGPPEGP